jgi:cytoskeletal protein CcmA (bactofilin family)
MYGWKAVGIAGTFALLLIVTLLPAVHAATQATGPRDKFRSGGEVTIAADETVPHDLYVSGGRVQIDGTIQGDLVAAGGDVDIDGRVQGDLIVAGGDVTIGGTVDGDVRAAGGMVRVEGAVQEDALVTAGRFVLAGGASIGQDLIFGTGQTTLDGSVAGGVLGSSGDYSANGTIGGSEDVTLDDGQGPTVVERLIGQLRRYITIVVLGLLLLWLAPRLFGAAARLLRERPLPSAGFGLAAVALVALALLVMLLAIVLAAIVLGWLGFTGLLATTIAGLLLAGGLLVFALMVSAFYLADAVVGVTIGRLLLRGEQPSRLTWALLLGVLIVVVLTAIPLVGGLLQIVAAVLGIGALVWSAWRRGHTPAPASA